MSADENVAISATRLQRVQHGRHGHAHRAHGRDCVALAGPEPDGRGLRGHRGHLAYFGQLAEKTGGTFRAELQHMAAVGDTRVVGIQRSTADRNGKHLDVDNCIVFELRDGRVVDGRERFEDLYAWDEFWA